MALAQNITVIPARRTIGTQKPAEKVQKTRVAAYCRVSTEFEEQESSYEVQVEHYTAYIKSNLEWELVEVYADASGKIGLNQKTFSARGGTDIVLFLFWKKGGKDENKGINHL